MAPRGGIGPSRWGEAKDESLMRALSTAGQWKAIQGWCLFGALLQFTVCRDKLPASGASDRLILLQRSRVHQSGIPTHGASQVLHHATRPQ
jgi:hypothetical protein